jgi:hypothetical protein
MQPFAAALAAARTSLAVAVTYRRGGSSVSLRMLRGRRDEVATTVDGNAVANQMPDWIGARSELAFSGTAITPTAGDVIEYQPATGPLEKYRVAANDATGRCYSTSDTDGTTLRIHTVRIANT